MQSQNRLIWIGLTVAVALGLTLEFMKSTRGSIVGNATSSIFGMGRIDDGDDARVLSLNHSNRDHSTREKADRARSRLLRGRIAGLGGTEAGMTPRNPVVVAAGKPNLAAPVAINLDAAKKAEAEKKARDAKKKKKKKKKPTVNGEPTLDTSTTSGDDDDDSSDTSSDFGGGSSSFAGGTSSHRVITQGQAVNENPETLEDWLAYILPEPNYDRTMKLITQNQTHAVDSEIFHEVITQMLADSRSKMHELAVLALGTSPSVKSFLLLEAANLAQSGNSTLRLQTRNYMKAYSKIENLRYLSNAISTDIQASTVYEALRLIQAAVTNYKPRATTPATGGTVSTSALVVRQFTPLVSVLTRLAQTATDATVQQEATTTLQQVRSLLGTPTPAV